MRIVGPAASLPVLILAFTFAATDGANAESKSPRKKVAALTPLMQHWNHNGSVVSLVSDGKKQKFVYDAPRVGLLDVGVKPGTVLFEGSAKATTSPALLINSIAPAKRTAMTSRARQATTARRLRSKARFRFSTSTATAPARATTS